MSELCYIIILWSKLHVLELRKFGGVAFVTITSKTWPCVATG
jgi:hypothetical protein